jgi:hypothetical protein
MNSTGKRWMWRLAVALGWMLCAVPLAEAAQSLCAEVKIEIRQELTLERQAFDAHMSINNGLPGVTVENVGVEVTFADGQGNSVRASSNPDDTNALFFISLDSLKNIAEVQGAGSVAPQTTADIHWLIIPAPGAGGASAAGTKYLVGAKLTCTMGGLAQVMDITPDYIFVKPMPLLTLDYFLPRSVYGDDAFTEPIEAPVPFSLGVRVRNAGHGVARTLKIDSGQPRIVENELGLLIGFNITGCEVNGRAGPGSLLADLGDIQPGSAGVARWVMECTLSGVFRDFSAEFSHADELGGQLTSLMQAVNTHLMVRDVLVDLPGRDGVRDFLSLSNGAYAVYESDNVDTPVSNRSDEAILTRVGTDGSRRRYTLTVPLTGGPFYAGRTNGLENSGNVGVVSATRSDGKRLHAANVWMSKTRATGNDPWIATLNLFDVNGGGSYSIVLEDRSAVPWPPVLQYIGDKVTRIGDALGLGFLVAASDPNGTIPGLATTPLPAGATFTTTVHSATREGTFFWRPQAGQAGIWPVKFTASDGLLTDAETVKLYVGEPGETLNAAGIPLSLAGWTARATNVVASSTSAAARVQWAGVPGIGYDLYRCDAPYAPGGMPWTRMASNVMALSYGEEWVDDALGTNRAWRLYQVTLAGEPAGSNQVWGVQRVPITAESWTLAAPPFRGDRRLSQGGLGQALGGALTGDNAGPGDGVGDELYALQPDGAWRLIWLDGGGAWREADGRLSTEPIPDGQGMLILRNRASDATATFTGQVGNDRGKQVVVHGGWNLLALSEGRELLLSAAFTGAGAGGPVGHAQQGKADQIVMLDEAGTGYWLMRVSGWGAPFDGQWVDLITLTIPALKIRPGQVIYYYRQPAAGNMPVTY